MGSQKQTSSFAPVWPYVRPWANIVRVLLAAFLPYAVLVVGLILVGVSGREKTGYGLLGLSAATLAALFMLSRKIGAAPSHWELTFQGVRETYRTYASPEKVTLKLAWEAVRFEYLNPEAVAAAEEKIKTASVLDGEIITAAALIAAARGRLPESRSLFESLLLLHPRVISPELAQLGCLWLGTNAAARGDWKEVERFCFHHRAPRTPRLALLGDVARRAPGWRRPAFLELWFTRHGLRLFTNTPWPEQDSFTSPSRSAGRPPEGALEIALRDSLRRREETPETVAAMARRWDQVLNDRALTLRLERRAAELGTSSETARRALRSIVETDLARRAKPLVDRGHAFPKAPDLLQTSLATTRLGARRELEDRTNRMKSRRAMGIRPPGIEVWKEFLAIRQSYMAASVATGRDERAAAFAVVAHFLNEFAVALYQKHNQKVMANAIFRFLETEARETGDYMHRTLMVNSSAKL